MTSHELLKLQRDMQELAMYHERERDSRPWVETEHGKYNNAVFHNQSASYCYSAAIAIGKLISLNCNENTDDLPMPQRGLRR